MLYNRVVPYPHLGRGWDIAMSDLQGDGRRWFVTPWVTVDQSQIVMQQSDRLIIRGKAKDFVLGSSHLGRLETLFAQGIEVRRLHDLHAKLYVREHDGGGVAWLGSANLTQRGQLGDRQNVEVMAGPFDLDAELKRSLERLWYQAEPLSLETLKEEIDRYRLTSDDLRQLMHTSVLALRVSFRYGQGRCVLLPKWLNIDTKRPPWNDVTFPSLGYFHAKSPMVRRWRNLKERELRQLCRLGLLPVEGEIGEGLYLLRLSSRAQIEIALERVRERIRASVLDDILSNQGALKNDFAERFLVVFRRFKEEQQHNHEVQAYLYDFKEDEVVKLALEQYDKYAGGNPANLSYSFFIPLHGETNTEDEISVAAKRLLQQPQINFR